MFTLGRPFHFFISLESRQYVDGFVVKFGYGTVCNSTIIRTLSLRINFYTVSINSSYSGFKGPFGGEKSNICTGFGPWLFCLHGFNIPTVMTRFLHVIIEVFTAVMMMVCFWVFVLCRLVSMCQCFRETYCLHLQGVRWRQSVAMSHCTWHQKPDQGFWIVIFLLINLLLMYTSYKL
jgi:hypothetical protein